MHLSKNTTEKTFETVPVQNEIVEATNCQFWACPGTYLGGAIIIILFLSVVYAIWYYFSMSVEYSEENEHLKNGSQINSIPRSEQKDQNQLRALLVLLNQNLFINWIC